MRFTARCSLCFLYLAFLSLNSLRPLTIFSLLPVKACILSYVRSFVVMMVGLSLFLLLWFLLLLWLLLLRHVFDKCISPRTVSSICRISLHSIILSNTVSASSVTKLMKTTQKDRLIWIRFSTR